jgi:hypothetical protein
MPEGNRVQTFGNTSALYESDMVMLDMTPAVIGGT